MFTSMRFWIISFVIALPCLFLQPAYACTAADDNYIHEISLMVPNGQCAGNLTMMKVFI